MRLRPELQNWSALQRPKQLNALALLLKRKQHRLHTPKQNSLAIYRTWVTDAQKEAFEALARAAAAKRTKHAPAAVIPFSAGGGLRACSATTSCCRAQRTATGGTGCEWS